MNIEQFAEALRDEKKESPLARLRELPDPREISEHTDPRNLRPLRTETQERR